MTEFPVKPLPRWTILPGDPPALQRWLRAKAAADSEPLDDADQQEEREAS